MATKQQKENRECTLKVLSQEAAKNKTPLPYSHIVVMIDRLHRHETTLRRLYTTQCNRYLSIYEKEKIQSTEECVKNIARALCIPVGFNDDPRGGAIRFVLSDHKSNNLGGEDWSINW